MKTEIRLITPLIAKQILEKNTMNRNMRNVNHYARQMSCGLWKDETGEAIKIATDGTLLDGQQRLSALIKANVNIMFLVITGLEKDVFNVLDTGAMRSGGDTFHISGVPDANNMFAGIKKYYILKTGNTQFALSPNSKSKFTNIEALALYNKRVDFWNAAQIMARGWSKGSSRILTKSEFLGFYALFYDIDDIDAFKFMSSLSDGVDLSFDSPVRILRERLLLMTLNKKLSLVQREKTALIYKAWNHFRKGRKLKTLRYHTDTETYPVPI